jgi:hypothetical protein
MLAAAALMSLSMVVPSLADDASPKCSTEEQSLTAASGVADAIGGQMVIMRDAQAKAMIDAWNAMDMSEQKVKGQTIIVVGAPDKDLAAVAFVNDGQACGVFSVPTSKLLEWVKRAAVDLPSGTDKSSDPTVQQHI